MFRISTPTGLVDVTDDHSLLTEDGDNISPKDVKIGYDLLHKKIYEKDVTIELLDTFKRQYTKIQCIIRENLYFRELY